MPLINLNEKFTEVKEACTQLLKTNVRLTDEFKNVYGEFIRQNRPNGYASVDFCEGYAVFTSTGNKISYIVNAGFRLAEKLSEYLKVLKDYKQRISDCGFADEQIKRFKGQTSLDLSARVRDPGEATLLSRFLTDYDWWGGGKTIERGDFYVSALMKCAGLHAESQTGIADLAEHFLDNPALITTDISLPFVEDRRERFVSGKSPDSSLKSYLAAICTKPFILLAGISGTGKSRLVRQLAMATCPPELRDDQKPGNYEMIPVRPNWHDSTELIGFISRISGKPEYIITDFVRFLVKACLFKNVPFFLCLDEMNLAPVEQYFAEYLSIIETRRKNQTGIITTDHLVKFDDAICDSTVNQLLNEYAVESWKGKYNPDDLASLKKQLKTERGIRIPENLVVMGTVNMDETTFSFSRKVLDRAMSFELNQVDLRSGLSEIEDMVNIRLDQVVCRVVTAGDVYESNKDICDKVIGFLETINEKLEETPFKIAYRTRNEVMIYVLARLAYEGTSISDALDEATNMKILSRIEGDEQRISNTWLEELKDLIVNSLTELDGQFNASNSVSCRKLLQMKNQLRRGYASFWS